MAMLEIARMYPEQIPPEVVVENSTLANKEVVAGQIESAESVQRSEKTKKAKRDPSTKLRTGKPEFSRDFVNILTR